VTTTRVSIARPQQAKGAALPNFVLAIALGIAYLTVGLVALAVHTGAVIAASERSVGAGFGLPRCGAYLGVGAILLIGAANGRARLTNTVIGASYLSVGLILELFLAGGPRLLTLNHVENFVQLGTAALLIGFGRTQD
jgi:hypothetical protein